MGSCMCWGWAALALCKDGSAGGLLRAAVQAFFEVKWPPSHGMVSHINSAIQCFLVRVFTVCVKTWGFWYPSRRLCKPCLCKQSMDPCDADNSISSKGLMPYDPLGAVVHLVSAITM